MSQNPNVSHMSQPRSLRSNLASYTCVCKHSVPHGVNKICGFYQLNECEGPFDRAVNFKRLWEEYI